MYFYFYPNFDILGYIIVTNEVKKKIQVNLFGARRQFGGNCQVPFPGYVTEFTLVHMYMIY